MIRVIKTECGQNMTKEIKPLSERFKKEMRDAMIGCGTDHETTGEYVQIKDVLFFDDEIQAAVATSKFNIKGVIIGQIINALNVPIINNNKKLCAENLHSEQAVTHGADMFFQLAGVSDEKLNEVAKAAGL